MKVVVFAASNSTHSINQRLALWAAQQLPDADIDLLDLNDYELPIYSEAREAMVGSPVEVQQFLARLESADVIIIGYAEHNGSYTAAWKNLSDWLSRTERRYFYDKPVLLLATSPGGGGAQSVLAQAKASAPHAGGDVIGAVSVPNWGDAFNVIREELVDEQAAAAIMNALSALAEIV